MQYEFTPITFRGWEGHYMSNKTTNETPKVSKKYTKTRGEHLKDIVIAMLITAIIAFVGGVWFQKSQHAEIRSAVQAATVVTNTPVKK